MSDAKVDNAGEPRDGARRTLSLLFTDIEGSTGLWESHPDWMEKALRIHYDLITERVNEHGGHVFKRLGDGLSAGFETAEDAVAAALNAQRALQTEFSGEPRLRVRMAVHTGVVDCWGDDYLGEAVNRAARLLSLANGGQVLVSGSSKQLICCRPHPTCHFTDLGIHHLRGMAVAENVYQASLAGSDEAFPPLRYAIECQGNLPEPLNSFVGRQSETARAEQIVASNRMVTLSGTGGIGKTRFAIVLGTRLRDEFEDGVWLVALDRIDDPSQVPNAIARCFSVQSEPGATLVDALRSFLDGRKILLILDNCEHVLEAAKEICSSLLAGARRFHILTTSREILDMDGEVVFRVPPLGLPPALDPTVSGATPQETAQVAESESGRLFLDRVKAAKIDFELTPSGAVALSSLLRKLDGIPLAIELSAARCRSMSLEDLSVRIGAVFKLLTQGGSSVPRHKTLEATMDWSYGLLCEREQALFTRLAVFQGGWSLDAAEAVCGFDPIPADSLMDLMASLVDKSLVQTDESAIGLRFRFLEPIRQYASQRSTPDGQVQARHFDYFSLLITSAKGEFQGPNQLRWLNLFSSDHENVRNAIEWGLSNSDLLEQTAQAICNLSPYWIMRGHFAQARRLLESALSQMPGEPSPLWIDVLVQYGAMRVYSGDPSGVETIREALDWSQDKDPAVRGRVLLWLGLMSNLVHDSEGAEVLLNKALELLREAGDPDAGGYILLHLGNLAYARDDLQAAKDLYSKCLTRRMEAGDLRGVGVTLFALGHVARETEPEAAAAFYREAIANSFAVSDLYTLAGSLGAASFILLHENEPLEAAKVQGFAEGLTMRVQGKLDAVDRKALDRSVALTKERLSENAYRLAFEDGKLMSIESVIDRLSGSPSGEHSRSTLWKQLG